MCFQIDDCARVIADGRIGRAVSFDMFRPIGGWFTEGGELEYFPEEALERIQPRILPPEVARALVRLQTLPSLLVPQKIARINVRTKGYPLTLPDLLAGYERIDSGSIPTEEIDDWRWMLLRLLRLKRERPEVYDEVREDYALAYALEGIWSLPHKPEDWHGFPRGFLDDLRMLVEEWKKPRDERQLPPGWKKKLVRQFSEDEIGHQTARIQRLFYEALEALCAEEDPDALRKKGRFLYRGTRRYPHNRLLCRDLFLHHYALTGDAETANTLGKIYDDGRAEGGVPDHAQAFFYFSIGYAAGFYESACKLGDLFVQGLGIVPNQRIALRLYEEVYDNTRHAFCLGEHTQFADAALRMGNCYSQGIGVAVDHARAYGYDLEANLALAQRAPEDDVGDAMLAADLHRALQQEKQAYDKPCVQPDALPFHTWLLRIKKPFQQMLLR